jgi:hypothetical protein
MNQHESNWAILWWFPTILVYAVGMLLGLVQIPAEMDDDDNI